MNPFKIFAPHLQRPSNNGIAEYGYCMRCLYSIVILLLLTHGLLVLANEFSEADANKHLQCQLCHILVRDFQNGFDATRRDNYGGGNTRWEESRLGSYSTSEMRLMQITEKLCHTETDTFKSKCHGFVEQYEEDLESWWLKQWGPRQQPNPNSVQLSINEALYTDLCIQKWNLCCPKGHFGATCSPCAGWDATSQAICSNHGVCHGNETRVGTGKCQCHIEYAGDNCNECKVGYYPVQNTEVQQQTIECKACHVSCGESGCSGPESSQCLSCAPGWTKAPHDNADAQGCLDVDECNPVSTNSSQIANPCATQADTYCENTPGSFKCEPCHESCAPGSGCLGPNSNHCRACRTPGYKWNAEKNSCEDVDECTVSDSVCSIAGQLCTNTPGSFTCSCPPGTEEDDERKACVPQKETTANDHDGSLAKEDDSDEYPMDEKDEL